MDDPDSGLTLPEQFVLLLHKPDGSPYATVDRNLVTAGAELGELVLRHRIAVEKRKLRILGVEPTGVPRLDTMLAKLEKRAGPKNNAVDSALLLDFLQFRGQAPAFKVHRTGLAERGLLAHRPGTALGLFRNDRHVPDAPVRDALLAVIGQVVRVERPIDNRLAMLCGLVDVSGLTRPLGLDTEPERAMLKSISKEDRLTQAVKAAIDAAVVVFIA